MTSTPRTNWLLHSSAGPRRPGIGRSRLRLPATHTLAERKGGRWLSEARHPEECGNFRKLLTAEPESEVAVVTRPRLGLRWGATGAALRVCTDTDRARPALLNEGWDCFELQSAFPEFSAVGARELLPGLVNRIHLEVRTEPSARHHICQVGIARIASASGRLDEEAKCLGRVVCTSSGDIVSTAGSIDVLSPGSGYPGLTERPGGDYASGGPAWLQNEALVAHVLIEVDLHRGHLSVRVGDWSAEPAVVSISGLVGEEAEGLHWLPFASLTAMGQQARILDMHARAVV